jgi:hypothetical protein
VLLTLLLPPTSSGTDVTGRPLICGRLTASATTTGAAQGLPPLPAGPHTTPAATTTGGEGGGPHASTGGDGGATPTATGTAPHAYVS